MMQAVSICCILLMHAAKRKQIPLDLILKQYLYVNRAYVFKCTFSPKPKFAFRFTFSLRNPHADTTTKTTVTAGPPGKTNAFQSVCVVLMKLVCNTRKHSICFYWQCVKSGALHIIEIGRKNARGLIDATGVPNALVSGYIVLLQACESPRVRVASFQHRAIDRYQLYGCT